MAEPGSVAAGRTARIDVRVSPAEKHLLALTARNCRESLSTFMMKAALSRMEALGAARKRQVKLDLEPAGKE
jgi:uncharacterized protein (DUF1778 family)